MKKSPSTNYMLAAALAVLVMLVVVVGKRKRGAIRGDIPSVYQGTTSKISTRNASMPLDDLRRSACKGFVVPKTSHILDELASTHRLVKVNSKLPDDVHLSTKAFLDFDTLVEPELSLSPLVGHANTYYKALSLLGHDSQSVLNYLAAVPGNREKVLQALMDSPCRTRRRGVSKTYVISTVRDNPKRALEFVAYHLLLGASKITLLDVGTDQTFRAKAEDDLAPYPKVPGVIPRKSNFRYLPPLTSYLRPFIDEGLVEIVMARDIDPSIPSVPDVNDAKVLRAAFFRGETALIASREPDARVLVLEEVNEFLLITIQPRGATPVPSVRRDKRKSLQQRNFMCLLDLNDAGISPNAAYYSSSGLLIPKSVVVGPEPFFENGRPTFELAGFSVGNSKKLARTIVDAAAQKSNYYSQFPLLSTEVAAAFGKAFYYTQKETSEASVNDFYYPVSFRFGDGSSFQSLVDAPTSFSFLKSMSVMMTARVIKVLPSLQRRLTGFLDKCYLNPGNGSNAHVFAEPKIVNIAEFLEVPGTRAENYVHQMPEGASLRHSGFDRLYHDLLALLQIPRERATAKVSDPRILMCDATNLGSPTRVIGEMKNFRRLVDKHSRGNSEVFSTSALLNFETVFVPEVSPSPMVTEINTYFTSGGKREKPANRDTLIEIRRSIISQELNVSHCRRRHQQQQQRDGTTPRIIVLTSVRDDPKKALEFVAYHLLLGAHKIVMLDVGSDSMVRDGSLHQDTLFTNRRTRERLPPLQAYLRPFIDDNLVEIVTVADVALQLSQASNSFETRVNVDIPDHDIAAAVMHQFFKLWTDIIYNDEPDARVLLLADTSQFVVITTPRKTHVEPTDHNCLFDLFDETVVPASSQYKTAAGGLIIPRIVVAPADAFADVARTVFEYSYFATGNTDTMMRDAVDLARIRVNEAQGRAKKTMMVAIEDFAVFGTSAAAFANEKFEMNGFVDVTAFRFADGRNLEHVFREPSSFSKSAETRYTVRVVQFGPTIQRFIEELIDGCYRAHGRGSRVALDIADAVEKWTTDSRNWFDDLPIPNGLKKNGFLGLHQEMLHLLLFKERDGLAETLSSLQVSQQAQQILTPYVVTIDKGLPVDNPAKITNENFIYRQLKFKEEHLVNPLSDAKVSQTFGALFGQKPLTHSSCPFDKENTLDLVNITFCAIVRNRPKITAEWVLYHKLLGVGRFLIADDSGTDALSKELAPLIKLGFVKLFKAHEGDRVLRFRTRVTSSVQFHAFAKCVDYELYRSKKENHRKVPWVGLLDVDEFVTLTKESDMNCLPYVISRTMKQVTSSDQILGGLSLQWRVVQPMVSNIFDTSLSQMQRTGYFVGSPDGIERMKMIVRADAVSHMLNAHKAVLRDPFVAAFPGGHIANGLGWWSGPVEQAQAEGFLLVYQPPSLISWLRKQLEEAKPYNLLFYPFHLDTFIAIWRKVARPQGTTLAIHDLREFKGVSTPVAILEDLLRGDDRPHVQEEEAQAPRRGVFGRRQRAAAAPKPAAAGSNNTNDATVVVEKPKEEEPPAPRRGVFGRRQ